MEKGTIISINNNASMVPKIKSVSGAKRLGRRLFAVDKAKPKPGGCSQRLRKSASDKGRKDAAVGTCRART